MKESLIAKRSFDFGLSVIRLTKELQRNYENTVLIKQIIRSATSIGANIEEALGSNSSREFIHSMNIAKKEARETIYWLKLLGEVNGNINDRTEVLLKENYELVNMLTKIVKTSSENHINKNL